MCDKTLLKTYASTLFDGQVDCMQTTMSRRGLSGPAAVCRSTYSGEELRYTNADFFPEKTSGMLSEIGLAARELWVRLGRSRRSLSSRLQDLSRKRESERIA